MKICPKCKSNSLHRSRTRSFVESWSSKFGFKYFRCHACQWRGVLSAKSSNRVSSTKARNRYLSILFGLMGLVIFYLMFLA
jgi:hypothetical protein